MTTKSDQKTEYTTEARNATQKREVVAGNGTRPTPNGQILRKVAEPGARVALRAAHRRNTENGKNKSTAITVRTLHEKCTADPHAEAV